MIFTRNVTIFAITKNVDMMKSPHACKNIYGLIGYPLVHSFSRDFFNQKFMAEDIDAQYINFEIEDIGQLMEVIAEYPNLNGLNVTARPVQGSGHTAAGLPR